MAWNERHSHVGMSKTSVLLTSSFSAVPRPNFAKNKNPSTNFAGLSESGKFYRFLHRSQRKCMCAYVLKMIPIVLLNCVRRFASDCAFVAISMRSTTSFHLVSSFSDFFEASTRNTHVANFWKFYRNFRKMHKLHLNYIIFASLVMATSRNFTILKRTSSDFRREHQHLSQSSEIL